MPSWEVGDGFHPLLTLMIGRYPAPDAEIADYKGGVQNAFDTKEIAITPTGEIPASMLESITPLGLTAYDLSRRRDRRGWLGPGVVLGSAGDFDTLVMF